MKRNYWDLDTWKKVRSPILYLLCAQMGYMCGLEAVFISLFSGSPSFETAYNYPNAAKRGLVTAMYPLFAVFGCFVVAFVTRYVSAKVVLTSSVYVWVAGFLTAVLWRSYSGLLLARMIKGAAIGTMSSALPLFVDKLGSKGFAARLLTLFQIAVPLGIIVESLVQTFLFWKAPKFVGFHICWVYAAVPALPAAIFVWALFLFPARGQSAPDHRFRRSWLHFDSLRALWRDKDALIRLVWASIVQVSVPLSGINLLLYYMSDICRVIGLAESTTSYVTLGLYATNLIGTTLSLLLVQKVKLVSALESCCGTLFLIHSAVFLTFFVSRPDGSLTEINPVAGFVGIAFFYLFVLVFSMLFASLSYVYTSQIVAHEFRTVSLGVAVGIGWMANFALTYVSPILLEKLGSIAFFLFQVSCSVLCVAFTSLRRAGPEIIDTVLLN